MPKNLILFIILPFFLISAYYAWWQSYQSDLPKLPLQNYTNAFVVVELFTSQGCSSCPIANSILKNLKNLIQENNLAVFPVAFHVDYWNHLGWKDTFSDKKYTARQYSYAHSFSNLNVYTPQIILNGTNAFAASNEKKCLQEIIKTLDSDNARQFRLNAASSIKTDSIEVSFNVENSFSGMLNIALVEKESMVSINQGENRGEKLVYQNIVRQFSQVDCRDRSSGKIYFEIPEDMEKGNMHVIVYLQNKVNMQILNAAKAPLL